jgi:hypothetical protein
LQWIGVIAGFVFLAWLWRYCRARPLFACAFFFILFQFVLRAISSIFLDAFGPVFAVEVLYEVGGTGATLAWVLSAAIAVVVVGRCLDPASLGRAVRAPPEDGAIRGAFTLGDLGFWLAVAIVASMYVDMLAGGVIPLFEGLERWEYTEEYAGPVHQWFFEYGNLLSLLLGVLSVHPRTRGGDVDLRFFGVMLAILLYAFLAAHRFSAFYAFTSMFLLPFAILFVPGIRPVRSGRRLEWLRRLLTSRSTRVLGFVLLLAIVIAALLNSLLNVRGFEPGLALFSFFQRVFVQPQQMWFLSYERVFLLGEYEPLRAFDFLFFDPIVPDRNSSVQYLMSLAIGEAYAARILAQGMQFAGGYPEVLFEMLGPWFGWIPVVVVAAITGLLLRELLKAIFEGRFVSAFGVLYVLYAFLLTYIGGMLNNLVNPVFWLKVLFMIAVLLLERRRDGSSKPLIPWVLWAPHRARAVEGRP